VLNSAGIDNLSIYSAEVASINLGTTCMLAPSSDGDLGDTRRARVAFRHVGLLTRAKTSGFAAEVRIRE
jgi:hypothetical protein